MNAQIAIFGVHYEGYKLNSKKESIIVIYYQELICNPQSHLKLIIYPFKVTTHRGFGIHCWIDQLFLNFRDFPGCNKQVTQLLVNQIMRKRTHCLTTDLTYLSFKIEIKQLLLFGED